MPFQFYCPQGHLLQGDESQMGQQSQCPLCGSMFVIPMLQAPAAPAPAPPPQPAAPEPPPKPAPPPEPEKPKEPEVPQVVNIPCPKGHLLETPSDILGQVALCPYCNAQFELRYEDSVEYREEREAAAKKREEELNALWVKWTIRAAIGVAVMFALMFLWVLALRPLIEYMMKPAPAPAATVPAETAPTPAPAPAKAP